MVDLDALKVQLYSHARSGCLKVLQGELAKYSNPFLSPEDYEEILKDLGAEHCDGEGESNGWQHDYWEYWLYKGQKYCQSGSGHYAESNFSKP